MIDDPGTKRIGYAVTDITFQNIIRTDLESIEDIEADISFDTFDEYEAYKLLNKDNDKWLL
jgi:RNase H-fold protein (predicted Holliday junction resolvase)